MTTILLFKFHKNILRLKMLHISQIQ